MGEQHGHGKVWNSGHRRCSGKHSCGYQWTWATRATCFKCSRAFDASPRPGGPAQPKGVWAGPSSQPAAAQAPAPSGADGGESEQHDAVADIEAMEKCLKAMEAAGGGGSTFKEEIVALEAKIAAVRKERAESRPLSAQVRSLESKLARKKKTAELAHGKLEEAQQALLAAQGSLLAAEKHVCEAKAEVASLEEQHQNLCQRASREAGEGVAGGLQPGRVPTFEQFIVGVPKELRDQPDLAEKIKQAEAVMAELREKCPTLAIPVADADPGRSGDVGAAQAAGEADGGEPMAVDELVASLLQAADGVMEGGYDQTARSKRVKELLETSFAVKRQKAACRSAPYG